MVLLALLTAMVPTETAAASTSTSSADPSHMDLLRVKRDGYHKIVCKSSNTGNTVLLAYFDFMQSFMCIL